MVLVADPPVAELQARKAKRVPKSPSLPPLDLGGDEGHVNLVDLVVSAPLLQPPGGTAHPMAPVVPLALGDEVDAIVEALKSFQSKYQVHIRSNIGTVESLAFTLSQAAAIPLIFHFMGHGTETSAGSALLLEDSTGIATLINAADLRVFLPSQRSLPPCQLAVLNACHSQGLADVLLDAGVRHVIAVNAPDRILDEAARLFTRNLYPALLSGHSVRNAFEYARNSVRSDPKLKERIDPYTWRPVNWDEAFKFRLLPENSPDHNRPLAFFNVPGSPVFSPWDNTNLTMVSADPFVGRQHAIHELAKKLHGEDEKRCVMLHGMGGMGKTALAEAVGRWQHERRRWSGGVWFIELRQTKTAAQARDRIAAILQVPARNAVDDDLLARAIDNRHILLILNDVDELFENDNDNAIGLLKTLMARRGVRLLVTGRHDLPGMIRYNRYEVGRLDVQGTLVAFQRYAPPLHQWGSETSRAADLAELLEFLDGYPLPIRLAATYLQQTRCSLRELLDRLNANPLPTLRYPSDRENRDTSLRATLNVSFDALPLGARDVFPLLGMFPNGLTSTAAQAILGQDSLLALETLLVFSMAELGEGQVRRFVIPEPARHYAESKQLPDAIARFCPPALTFYHEFIRVQADRLADGQGIGHEEARLALIQEWANILRVLDWGYDAEVPNSYHVSWSAHATAMLAQYWIQVATGQHLDAFTRLDRAARAARRLQDVAGEAQVNEAIADIRNARGEFTEAAMFWDMSIAGFRTGQNGHDEARVQEKKGNALEVAGLLEKAQEALVNAAEGYRRLGNCPVEETRVLRRLLRVLKKRTEDDAAILICERIEALCVQLRDLAGRSQIVEELKALRKDSKERRKPGKKRRKPGSQAG